MRVDPAFRRIGEIIKASIDRLVLHLVARGSVLYGNTLIPQEVRDMVRGKKIKRRPVIQGIPDMRHIIASGKSEYPGDRYQGDEQDYAKLRIRKPFSMLEAAGPPPG